MKHKIRVIALLLGTSGLLFAGSSKAAEGFYVGASAGYSALNTPSGSAFDAGTSTIDTLITETSSTSDTGGFGGGLFVGYNLNTTFAVELGYTSYADSSYSSEQAQYTNIGTDTNGNTEWAYTGSNSSSLSFNTHSVDLFLKGTAPVIAKISAFAKVGISYVNQKVDYSSTAGTPTIDINSNSFATPAVGTNTYSAFRPAGALGLSYQATEHLSASIFAQGFLGKGDFSSDSDAIASAYILGASLSYNFL